MKRIAILIVLVIFLMCDVSLNGTSQHLKKVSTKRFALVVGANDGGADRVILRYAVSDAKAMKKVLEEMGGISPADSILLEEPDRRTLFTQLGKMKAMIKKAKEEYRRVEAILYYSGHSDEQYILLGSEKISYKEYREAINGMKADVRIAILDSCAPGAFTRVKGGKKTAPFLLDTAYNMKGYAFMASSSSTEASQESDRLKASFFTHNLISGLRGAADMTPDGRITLNEAYQYAFNATLSQTENTMRGPQHPSYNIQMSGTGDVVMTDIQKSSSVLVIKKDVFGKIFIHNKENVLVIELTKPFGRDLELGLEHGKYRVLNIRDSHIFEAKITLKKGKCFELNKSFFTKTDIIYTRSRGDGKNPAPEGKTKRRRRFKLEIYGGYSALDPADLNRRAITHRDGQKYWFDDAYTYWKNLGYITTYYRKEEGEFREIKNAFPFGLRLKYYLNKSFALSLGYKYISKTEISNFTGKYTIVESSGEDYVYRSDTTPFILSVKGMTPMLGVHFEKKLSPAVDIEGFITGGPLFGKNTFSFDDYEEQNHELDLGEDFNRFILKDIYERYVKEEGEGTGFALELGARLNFKIKNNFQIFIESVYAYQQVKNLRGPGIETINGVTKTWEGEWGMKEWTRERPWGNMYSLAPSNYWLEDHNDLRAGDFTLDLSGFQLRIGVSYKF